MDKRVLIFFPHKLKQRHGGPYSMLFHLKEGLCGKQHAVQFLSDIIDLRDDATSQPDSSHGFVRRTISLLVPLRWKRNHRIRQWLKMVGEPDQAINSHINLSKYDVVHFHETIDVWRYRSLLQDFKGTIVLTSHSPKPYYQELLEDVMQTNAFKVSKSLVKQLQSVDRFAHEKVDVLVFPCREATEPYLQCWPAFKSLLANKNTAFIPTGVIPSQPAKSTDEVRRQLGIPPDAFVVTFIGRKIPVKGYDLLQEAAHQLLHNLEKLYFVVVGRESDTKPMASSRWIETGWTDDPFSFVMAGDIHAVPNRLTNFDLNVLEVLSLGKPLLLSLTGGSKYFQKFQSAGIFFHLPTANALAEQIENLYRDKALLPQKGAENKVLYDNFFTAGRFADDHRSFYESL